LDRRYIGITEVSQVYPCWQGCYLLKDEVRTGLAVISHCVFWDSAYSMIVGYPSWSVIKRSDKATASLESSDLHLLFAHPSCFTWPFPFPSLSRIFIRSWTEPKYS
jgi:hypothetical protein